MPFHGTLQVGNNHPVHSLEFVTTGSRDAYTGSIGDIGRIARVTGDSSFWILSSVSPITWVSVVGSGSGGTSGSTAAASASAAAASASAASALSASVIALSGASSASGSVVSASASAVSASGSAISASMFATSASGSAVSASVSFATISASVAALSIPYDFMSFAYGTPSPSDYIGYTVLPRAVSIPAGLTGSQGVALTASTSASVFSIRKNGAQIGTATFAAGGTTATFSASIAVTLSASDTLAVVTPSASDATLSNVAITIKGEVVR